MPYFTVVVPTFNRVAKLTNAIQSVLNQTCSDFELLVMDDGSTDGSEHAAKSFRDERIRYEWAPNSGGPATPRNRGIAAAAGPWISFLDADDVWYPERLERVAQAIRSKASADVVCHNEMLHVVSTGEKTRLRYGPQTRQFYRVMLTDGNNLSTSAVTIRCEFLRRHGLRFNEAVDYIIVEDYDLWLRLANHGAQFCFINDVLGEYRIEDDNLSRETGTYRANLDVVVRDHVYRIQQFEPDKDKLWREILRRQELQEAGDLMRDGNVLQGVRQFLRVMSTAPLVTLRHGLARIERKAARLRQL